MARKKAIIPEYSTTTIGAHQYYRTRITDADGKQYALYATTREELYKKQKQARREVKDLLYCKANPTVEEYCEKCLLMKSATISATTLRNYTNAVNNYIVKPLGHMYLSEVTTYDITMALLPVSKKSKGTYDQVHMLLKCIFTSALQNQLIDYSPAEIIPAGAGKPTQKKEVLTDEQANVLLEAVRGLPPYLFIMIGLHSVFAEKRSWHCSGTVFFLMHPHPIFQSREHGGQRKISRKFLQFSKPKLPDAIFPFQRIFRIV